MQDQGNRSPGRGGVESAFEAAFGTGENDFGHGGSRTEGGRKRTGAYIGVAELIAIGRNPRTER